MRKKTDHNNVPTITNLIVAGNPEKKKLSSISSKVSSHLNELNQRIDEIENAIGQNNKGPVGRAFAIRAETNRVTKPRPAFVSDTETFKTR